MQIWELLNEGVNDQFLYHSVPDGPTVMQILKSGFIKPQKPFDFDREMDRQRGVKSVNRISLTRSQYLRFPYGHGVAQFVIDKNALRRAGYKVVPKVGAMMDYKYETEEQVYKPIPVKSPFVIEIQYDPNLKIPKSFLDRAKTMGIKVSPWRKEGSNPNIKPPENPGPQPQTEFTDVKKLKINGNGYTYGNPPKKVEATEWYVGYSLGDGEIEMLSPRSTDKAYIQNMYKQIKDRVAKGLTFDDLLPARQFRKEWQRGYSEIHPGEKDWKN
jgi:hypothetical protein